MNSRFTPNQNSYSNDEADDETTMSQSGDEPTDKKLSQSLTTPKLISQKLLVGDLQIKKIHPDPTLHEELRVA